MATYVAKGQTSYNITPCQKVTKEFDWLPHEAQMK